MKRTTYLFILLQLIVFTACNKKDDDTASESANANTNIEGYWTGTWQSDQEYEGNYVAKVELDGDELEGDVSVIIIEPELDGYNVDFEGDMNADVYKILMDIYSVAIGVDGSLDSDSELSGRFAVSSMNMKGTYEGEKIEKKEIEISLLRDYEDMGSENTISDIICVNDEVWVIKYPYYYDNDGKAFLPVDRISSDGDFIGETAIEANGISYSRAGDYIYSIQNGMNLIKYSLNGEIIDTLALPFDGFTVTGNNSKLYFSYGFYQFLETDLNLNVTDTSAVFPMPVYNMAMYGDEFLVVHFNSIFCFNKEGVIRCAYELSEYEYIPKIVTSSNAAFLLIEEFNTEGDEWSYQILKVTGLD